MRKINFRRRAAHAVKIASEKCGIGKTNPKIVHRSNHFCFLLPEHSTIARVIQNNSKNILSAQRELTITRHVFKQFNRVIPPHPLMPFEPLTEDDLVITFWPNIPHEVADYDNLPKMQEAALALHEIHRALSTYRGELPSFSEKIEECAAQLHERSVEINLSNSDRLFLLDTYDRLRDRLAQHRLTEQPIHGDAHMGNVFFTRDGPLWTDFEAACRGPREWDAATILHASAFPDIDHSACDVLSKLHSFCMSVWCSALVEVPGKQAALAYHLTRLKNVNW